MFNTLPEGVCRGERGLANRRLQPLGHVTNALHALERGSAGAADAANGSGSSRHEKRHTPFPGRSSSPPPVAALYVQAMGGRRHG